MPGARDPDKAPVKHHEHLTWMDSLRGRLQGTHMTTDPQTGEVYTPRRRFLEQRAKQRYDEAQEREREGK